MIGLFIMIFVALGLPILLTSIIAIRYYKNRSNPEVIKRMNKALDDLISERY
jgi:hypothetical protein